MPQTSIYGKDYSLKPASDLQASRANEASNYSLQVSGNGVDLTIKASDIDLRTTQLDMLVMLLASRILGCGHWRLLVAGL